MTRTDDFDIRVRIFREFMNKCHVSPDDVQANAGDAIEDMVTATEEYTTARLHKATAILLAKTPSTWPSTESMLDLMERLDQNPSTKKSRRVAADKDRVPGKFANVNGWGYDHIMHTAQGRAARARGKPHQFLMDVVKGRINADDLTFTLGAEKRPLRSIDNIPVKTKNAFSINQLKGRSTWL